MAKITLDIPAATFHQLELLAADRGMTLKQVVRSAVEREILASSRRRVRVPIIKSKEPGTLNLTNAEIEDFLT
jgi:hypothetical protein